ncbi:O-antigen ligase family protein [Candidatus Pelagibacter bacterium nBUS_27]|uniref:O-antigen ligase family protein n=1 Tax=Candidatus Pelagibacter bacterium nBUS_27 TaxID=3374188 RepID=UPI003EBBC451
MNHDINILKKLFYVFLLIFSILVFDGFFQFFSGKNILGYILNPGPRVSSFFNEELILGSYLSRLFPIFFGLMVYFYNTIKKTTYYYSLCLFILSEILIYLSGERAAFFHMNLSSIFILFFIRKFRKVRLVIMSLSLIFIVVISNSFPATKNRVIDQTIKQMNLSSGKVDKVLIFSEQHDHIIRTALKIAKDNIFFGVGVKNFRHFCSYDEYEISIYSCNNHPHNTYVQLVSELGLFGLSFALYLLYLLSKFTIIHFFRLFKKEYYFDDFQVCLISAILISLWPLVPTGNLFNNWLSIIYYFPVGILLWSFNKKRNV